CSEIRSSGLRSPLPNAVTRRPDFRTARDLEAASNSLRSVQAPLHFILDCNKIRCCQGVLPARAIDSQHETDRQWMPALQTSAVPTRPHCWTLLSPIGCLPWKAFSTPSDIAACEIR